jgi:hypothetical protein
MEKTCKKIVDLNGTTCNQPIEDGTQSHFCPQHRNHRRCKPHRKTEISIERKKKIERVLLEQVRAEIISEILSLPQVIGFREATNIVIDGLKILLSRLGTSNLEYAGDE